MFQQYPLELTLLIIILITIITIHTLTRKRKLKRTIHEMEQYEKELNHELFNKEGKLNSILNQINSTQSKHNSLTPQINNVLDNYNTSNIRIPIDIIEDLHAQRLTTEEDIQLFIENQRYYWKLENSKKLLKLKGDN